MTRKLTQQEFIDRANGIHAHKYSYEKCIYRTAQTKVIITCPIHEDFNQHPHHHLTGRGCKDCSVQKKRIIDFDKFVSISNECHPDSGYLYDKSTWIDADNMITILCPIHGQFMQRPHSHMRGKGCYQCGRIKLIKSNSLTTAEFIKMAKLVHEDRYVYDLVLYTTSQHYVDIICPTHGIFTQTATNHLSGHGCNKCRGRISTIGNEWLDNMGISSDNREVYGLIPKRKYSVDGYNPTTNTIYEFYGDYWHGNPTIYDSNKINPSNGKTYGSLYEQTCKKAETIRQHGYTLVEIWENDFKTSKYLDI